MLPGFLKVDLSPPFQRLMQSWRGREGCAPIQIYEVCTLEVVTGVLVTEALGERVQDARWMDGWEGKGYFALLGGRYFFPCSFTFLLFAYPWACNFQTIVMCVLVVN